MAIVLDLSHTWMALISTGFQTHMYGNSIGSQSHMDGISTGFPTHMYGNSIESQSHMDGISNGMQSHMYYISKNVGLIHIRHVKSLNTLFLNMEFVYKLNLRITRS